MPLPSWVGERVAKAKRPVSLPVADSLHTAPGWRVVGGDFYTCVEPPDRYADRLVTKMIRSFDPGAIPIWRKQRYLMPGATVPITVTHFGIARHVKNPHAEVELFHVEMPLNADHPVPNKLECIFEVHDDTMMHDGGPGGFIPWDMRIYHNRREAYNETKTGKQLGKQHEAAVLEKVRRAQLQRAIDFEFRQQLLDAFVNRKLGMGPQGDSAIEQEWRAYFQRQKEQKSGRGRTLVFLGGR